MADRKRIEYVRTSGSPFKWTDIAIFGLVLAAVIMLIWIPAGKPKGSYAEISVAGARSVFELNIDRTVVLDELTVVIRGGKVHVTRSTCKNKVCEHMGEIGLVGQSITCAQNRIVITIRGDSGLAGTVG